VPPARRCSARRLAAPRHRIKTTPAFLPAIQCSPCSAGLQRLDLCRHQPAQGAPVGGSSGRKGAAGSPFGSSIGALTQLVLSR
jgi:hypothetical protein